MQGYFSRETGNPAPASGLAGSVSWLPIAYFDANALQKMRTRSKKSTGHSRCLTNQWISAGA